MRLTPDFVSSLDIGLPSIGNAGNGVLKSKMGKTFPGRDDPEVS